MSTETPEAVIVSRPMVQWEKIADSFNAEQRQVLADDCADRAVRLARMAAYFNARYLGLSHLAGVNGQNIVARQLRKALGFTYPSNDINF